MLWLLACSDYSYNRDVPDKEGETGCVADTEPAVVEIDETCEFAPTPGGWTPVVEWQWSASSFAPGYDEVMMMPAVGDVTGDGLSDIVFTAYSGTGYGSAGALVILSGSGVEEGAWTSFGGYTPTGSAGIALGDLDDDGVVEIVTMTTDARILVVHADGSLVWVSEPSSHASPYGYPVIANLDGVGGAEVIAGAEIYGADGTHRGTGAYGIGGPYAIPVVIDLDLDGQQEVITGNAAYTIDGTALWYTGGSDGQPAVADFDGDGLGEVVVVQSGSLWMIDTDGTVVWSVATIPGGGGGPPTVADFDGDGEPEIGVAGLSGYAVYERDGTMVWSQPTQDASSAMTGSSVFDFEGDGKSEVVYADELTLWGYDGATGTPILAEEGHSSWTLFEYPPIVDADNDGQAEIVLASNDSINTGWKGITVIGDASASWSDVAPVWNQHAWWIDNINDDLSVPVMPRPNWVTGSNSFRAGGPRDGIANPAPDLQVSITQVCGPCDTPVTTISVLAQNTGTEDVAGDISVSVYADDGTGFRTLVGRVVVPGLAAGSTSGDQLIDVESHQLKGAVSLVAVVDDDGTGAGVATECNEGNNEHNKKVEACG